MKNKVINSVYEFVYRGMLAEEALDNAGRKTKRSFNLLEEQLATILAINLMDDELIHSARHMSLVYTAIAAFENSVRELIGGILAENIGENWWSSIAKGIREPAEKRMEEEKKTKWHTQRGLDPINYTTLANLVAIMRHNWIHFEPYIGDIEWASNIFDALERSRNVIMHSGSLEKEDIERLGIYIRDWIKQVGS